MVAILSGYITVKILGKSENEIEFLVDNEEIRKCLVTGTNGSYCCVINCSNNAPKGFRLFRFRYLNSFIFFGYFKFCKV